LGLPSKKIYFDSSWLVVKQHYRKTGWFHLSKTEKKLLEQCLIRGFNLSMVPVEVGWPVAGNAIKKNLFIWQAYVLLAIMKYFANGDKFNVGRLMCLLNFEYRIYDSSEIRAQIIDYLKWLVMFGTLNQTHNIYTYIKHPKITTIMEQHSEQDKKYINVVAKLWKN